MSDDEQTVTGNGVVRDVRIPDDAVCLRPAEEPDAPFQFDLFRSHAGSRLRLGGLPEAMIEQLVAMQYRARNLGFREQFPAARWSVIQAAGTPVGELIVHEEPNALYIVDIAISPGHQQKGIGSAVVRSTMAAGAACGGVRAMVMVSNEASLQMFRRLGFSEARCDDGIHLELLWRPER